MPFNDCSGRLHHALGGRDCDRAPRHACAARRFLEEELARRYREAAPHTLAVLQERVELASRELLKAEAELRAIEDVGAVRGAAMRFATTLAAAVDQLLQVRGAGGRRRVHAVCACASHASTPRCSAAGLDGPRPGAARHDDRGGALALARARLAWRGGRRRPAQRRPQAVWRRRLRAVPPRVPGGRQRAPLPRRYSLVRRRWSCVRTGKSSKAWPWREGYTPARARLALSRVAPLRAAVATDRVANLLLAYKGRSASMAPSRAAEDIARQMAREMLGPLLDAACVRLAFVLRRAFDIAADRCLTTGACLGSQCAGATPSPNSPTTSFRAHTPDPPCREQQGHSARVRLVPRRAARRAPKLPHQAGGGHARHAAPDARLGHL